MGFQSLFNFGKLILDELPYPPFGFSYSPNLGIRFYGSVIRISGIPSVCVYIDHNLQKEKKNQPKNYLYLPIIQ